ncbi:hypothetical protein TRFO_11323 [Tritrichomonas foetus]|uniref:CLASP N-terminal domain-containing protein n=1 Tax=Tritrichomonas foetus TaxID=1144522 RepID=A0A1J4J4F2_9EUKA|nr:hypothetical protein TRFO_11323 [Tritrichomonas foetus]|eukprot:OHS94234.1 hypothetical protein TRFO_11323 [Tritrichomonas foetus]
MALAYGIIPKDRLHLPYDEFLCEIESSIAQFSYSPGTTIDFIGFFKFLVSYYQDCDEPEILRKFIELLSSIAGYKLGIRVGEVFHLAQNIILKLLSSPNVNNLKSAVDFYRKVSRVVGPRIVLQEFVIPNLQNIPCHRGLAIIAHQSIADNPKFNFTNEDFGDWVSTLSEVIGIGPRLISSIKQVMPDIELYDHITSGRPPSVPVSFNLTQHQPHHVSGTPSVPAPPHSARPGIPRRILTRKNPNGTSFFCSEPDENSKFASQNSIGTTTSVTNNSSNAYHPNSPRASRQPTASSIMFQMTSRQQQIREFVDEPFDKEEASPEYVQQCRSGLSSTDWEERSASYNQMKRILRYSTNSINEEDLHSLVTSVLDDICSQRSALALSAVGALDEAFLRNPQTMTFELSRIIPVILKLHQKTAQFFESALCNCFENIIRTMRSKRFLSVIVANGETKSSKIQAATSKYIRISLEKAVETSEGLFPRKSNEVRALVKLVSKLLNGSAAETRDAARESARYLSLIYSDSFSQIVDSALEPRDAHEFYKNT